MTDEHIVEMLDKLKNKELTEFFVSKEDFLSVRNVLVERVDFKHFRGIAQRGGAVIYQYSEVPRS